MHTALKLRIAVDVSMTVALLLLMAYELIGSAVHEIVGCIMMILFVVHHVLNRRWTQNIFKGRYTPYRTVQTALVVLIFVLIVGQGISGMILSRYVFASLPIHAGTSAARTVHMLGAYWSFILMSFHLGFHWNMMLSMLTRLIEKMTAQKQLLFRLAAALIAGYGLWAFFRRDIGRYLFLRSQFVFFDFNEPLWRFYLDYLSILSLFVCAGHYGAKVLRAMGTEQK